MDSVENLTVEMLYEIKKRSQLLVIDNIKEPTVSDFFYTENAMMIGASIALQQHTSTESESEF